MSIDLRCKHGRMVRELAAAHGLMLDRESRFPPALLSAPLGLYAFLVELRSGRKPRAGRTLVCHVWIRSNETIRGRPSRTSSRGSSPPDSLPKTP